MMLSFVCLAGVALVAQAQTELKCGCSGAACKADESCSTAGVCVKLPTQNWLADGAPFCVRGGGGRCCGDNFAASCAASEACVQGRCVASVATACGEQPSTSQCWSCATPGVKSFFNGCNSCSCGAAGAICTKEACIAVVPDATRCASQCDGFRTEANSVCGSCTCKGQSMTNCSKCGGGDCDQDFSGGFRCAPVVAPTPCDNNTCKSDEKCVAEPKQCFTTPCPQYRCDKVVVAPAPCDNNTCKSDEKCVAEPKQCITTPCPQFRCEKPAILPLPLPAPLNPCFKNTCNSGETCVADPKKCDTTPCPQYRCEKPINFPLPPCANNDCKSDEKCIAEPKQCVTTPCPQYRCEKTATTKLPRDGKCFTCATPNIRSYSDGCNRCSCPEQACTLRACIEIAPAEGSCEMRCDGALVKSKCEECVCVNGAKTECMPVPNCADSDDQDGAAGALTLASSLLTVAVAAKLL